MDKDHEAKWLNWAKRIQSIAQQGLSYTTNKYELDRFQQLRDLSVEIMEEYTEAGEEKIKELFCFERGYQTPKVDVRAAIIEGQEILLVHEKIDDKWAMPGGWADIGLSVKENIVKEAKEEAGAIVEPTKFVGIFNWVSNTDIALPFAIYKIVMLCKLKGFTFHDNIETESARFFKRDDLPILSRGRSNEHLIDLCFDAYENPDFAPIVD